MGTEYWIKTESGVKYYIDTEEVFSEEGLNEFLKKQEEYCERNL